MTAPLDKFFLSLSSTPYGEPLRVFVIFLAVVGIAGFIYYWFVFARILFAAWLTALKDGNFFNWGAWVAPGVSLKPFIRCVLFWFLAGWPVPLFALGLLSSEALATFLAGK